MHSVQAQGQDGWGQDRRPVADLVAEIYSSSPPPPSVRHLQIFTSPCVHSTPDSQVPQVSSIQGIGLRLHVPPSQATRCKASSGGVSPHVSVSLLFSSRGPICPRSAAEDVTTPGTRDTWVGALSLPGGGLDIRPRTPHSETLSAPTSCEPTLGHPGAWL